MRLVVMIPAFNEETSIDHVIRSVPRDVLNDVNVIVIDDGSKDNTVKKARKAGADREISFKKNQGLGRAFKRGLEEALGMNANIIVNIDADGQYDPREIPELIRPIIEEKADIVLGSRFNGFIEHMPRRKRMGNIFATKVTNFLSGLSVTDTQTGFRAFSREAALRLNISSEYTYTQEIIIQAAYKGLRIVEVPCKFMRRVSGKSRLISNIFDYARKSGLTIIRTYRDYKPLRTFLIIGGAISILGIVIGLRVLIHFLMTGMVTPYLPSAILSAVLLIIGFQITVLSLIADMIGNNRKYIEDILYDLRKNKSKQNI